MSTEFDKNISDWSPDWPDHKMELIFYETVWMAKNSCQEVPKSIYFWLSIFKVKNHPNLFNLLYLFKNINLGAHFFVSATVVTLSHSCHAVFRDTLGFLVKISFTQLLYHPGGCLGCPEKQTSSRNYNLFVWSAVFQPKCNEIEKTYKIITIH